MTILVVDDDPSIRSVVSRGLHFEGYEVFVAADGLEALRIAREQTLDYEYLY
jgi:DNA-binding response OmpR family regulator